jgi:hypothetical protein
MDATCMSFAIPHIIKSKHSNFPTSLTEMVPSAHSLVQRIKVLR